MVFEYPFKILGKLAFVDFYRPPPWHAAAYQTLLDQLEEVRALEGIQRGLADVKAGKVTSLKDFEKQFRKKHGLARRPR